MNDSVLVRTQLVGNTELASKVFAKLSGKPTAEVNARALRSVTAKAQSYMQPYICGLICNLDRVRSRFAVFGIV